MNLEHNLSFLFILATCILFQIPGYLCQDQQYTTCTRPFQCGYLRNINYPFYGGDKPVSCGHPGFGIDCQDGVPLLDISSIRYRVLEINNNTQTLRVAREDLWRDICPEFLHNTTLDFQIFDYSSSSDDQNITLRYNCPDGQVEYRNQFTCGVNRTGSTSFYAMDDVSLPGNEYVCNDTVIVPVNQSAAAALAILTPTSINVLRVALASGFSIQWSADNSNCEECVGSGGACGYDQNTASFTCYCEDRPYPLTCNGRRNRNGGGLSKLEKIVTLVLSFTGILAIVIIYYFSKKCISDDLDEESNQNVAKFVREHECLAPRRYSYNEIKKMTKSFADKLGQGGFGNVYRGTLPEGRHVAVKVLNETKSNGEEFINEVASISRTSHVNIVNLLGFCYGKRKRALVYEFMPNKSLDKFLHQNVSTDTDFQLEWSKLHDIAVGVARGLEYLHRGCNARIVHFDIKPQNILLDKEFRPKISDFGLAKLCRKQQSILTSVFGTRGTIGYIAPEVFCRNFGHGQSNCVFVIPFKSLPIAGAVLAGFGLGWLILYCKQKRKRKFTERSLQNASKEITPTQLSNDTSTLPSIASPNSIPSFPYSKPDFGGDNSYFGVHVFSYAELEEATEHFNDSRVLGDGGFGIVYYGVLSDNRIVAVKRLYENNFKRVVQFMNELEILTRLRHQNLVTLYGCTSKQSRELLLVYEYIPNGTVADHLHGKRAKSGFLSWPVRLNIAVETAKALTYLHQSEIIHRDVKTNNILLDNDFHVKVADFGLSRLFPTDVTHVSTAPQGTPGYVDPEYYQCYRLTERSDVYSFGVVLIELISSLQAVDTNRHRHDINLANMGINKIQNHELHELVDKSLGFEESELVRRKITLVAVLAFRCLQQERETRPSMVEVLECLKRIQNDEVNASKMDIVDIVVDDDVALLMGSVDSLSPNSLVTDKSATVSNPNSI